MTIRACSGASSQWSYKWASREVKR